MWFEKLTGFREDRVDDVAAQFVIEGEMITSNPNGRNMHCGRFETPTLGELRQRWSGSLAKSAQLRVQEVVADVQDLHIDRANAGALFQVASQFNTLEMVSPSVTPEQGIDRYDTDHTQGPACAVACGAGTIYRNYLMPLCGQIGQTASCQVDCLGDLAAVLGVEIEMRNGYALPTAGQLDDLNEILIGADEPTRDALMAHLRIGLQWNTEVTVGDAGHAVSQAYCSALPVAHSPLSPSQFEPFARLVLDGAYEASVGSAILNAETTGNKMVYLTLLGGGVFANPTPWILDAIQRALRVFATADLDVAMVSHGSANPQLDRLLKSMDS